MKIARLYGLGAAPQGSSVVSVGGGVGDGVVTVWQWYGGRTRNVERHSFN